MRALRSGRGLSRFAGGVVAFMVLVIVEGAVVRATGSGNGCGNHWPLCNGEILPHHPRLATVIEFVHRQLTGVCTALVAGLIAWIFLAKRRGDFARKAAVWTGVLLLVEAGLGAVLVKGGYTDKDVRTARVFIQGVHFTNTMLLLGAMTLAWWGTRTREAVRPVAGARGVVWLALVATMVTGATGSVAALADTLFPSATLRAAIAQDFAANAPLLIRMRWLHPAAAVVGIGCAVWLGLRVQSAAARWVVVLAGVQVALGVADVLLLAPVWLQVLHLLGADLYWIAMVAAAAVIFERRVFRPV